MNKAIRLQSGPVAIASVAIVAALAWRFGVRPLEAKAMSLRIEADAAQQELAAARVAGEDVPPDAALVSQVNAVNQQIVSLAGTVQRKPRLHEDLAKVAQDIGVRIGSIEPRGKSGAIASNSSVKIASSSWSAEATGSYEKLARLVDAIETQIPLLRVQGFRMQGGGPLPGAPEATILLEFTNLTLTQDPPEGKTTGAGNARSEVKP